MRRSREHGLLFKAGEWSGCASPDLPTNQWPLVYIKDHFRNCLIRFHRSALSAECFICEKTSQSFQKVGFVEPDQLKVNRSRPLSSPKGNSWSLTSKSF